VYAFSNTGVSPTPFSNASEYTTLDACGVPGVPATVFTADAALVTGAAAAGAMPTSPTAPNVATTSARVDIAVKATIAGLL
jgi:hypothetical protein